MTAALVLTVPVAAGLTAVGPAAGAATPPAPGKPVAAGAKAARPAPVVALLPTGDRVTLARSRTGQTVVDIARVAASGAAGAFARRTTARGTYVTPATALPYVGRLLDPELFDVSRLGSSAKVKVRVTYAGATPAVPGLTVTSRTTGALDGYLTPRSARTFGAALAKQFAADAKKGFPARTTLFGATGIRSTVSAPVVVQPQFPMRTLIIKALDSKGAPLKFGFVEVFAVDDGAKYFGFGGIVVDGQARLSLPIGVYALHGVIFETDAAGNLGDVRLPVVDDYVVSTQNQVVTVDARTANVRPALTIPRPAALDALAQSWGRTDDAQHASFTSSVITSGGSPLYVQPQSKPAHGTLRSAVQFTYVGSPLSGTPFMYSANYSADAVPARQAHVFSTATAQILKPTYYADPLPREGQLARSVLDPTLGGVGTGVVTPLPSRRTEYVGGDPNGIWSDTLFASPDPFTNPFADLVDDGFRAVHAGTTLKVDWLRGPQLQRVPEATDGFAALGAVVGCAACRTADTMTIVLDPAQDTTPGHSIAVFGRADGVPVATFQVFKNGTKVFQENDTIGTDLPVTGEQATYRVVDVVDRRPSLALQSTSTRTDVTFVSSATNGNGLPKGQTCFIGDVCTVLPILTADVRLPVDGRNAVPLGTSTIGLKIGHLAGAKKTAITSAAVEVRFPGGAWTALPITRTGNGSYTARFTAPAGEAGASVHLRVTGRDAAGGVIVQTALNAFAVNAS